MQFEKNMHEWVLFYADDFQSLYRHKLDIYKRCLQKWGNATSIPISPGQGSRKRGYPVARPKKGPGSFTVFRIQTVTENKQKFYKFTITVRYEIKLIADWAEKRLRAYRFLQRTFVSGKILEPTTDLNGFSLIKFRIRIKILSLDMLCLLTALPLGVSSTNYSSILHVSMDLPLDHSASIVSWD